MDQATKLDRASKACWFFGMIATANFFRVVIASNWATGMGLSWVIALPCAMGVQWVFTLMTASLISGEFPAFWRINWLEGGFLPVRYAFALMCLFVDVLLNVGGVGIFTSKLAETDIGQDMFGMSPGFVSFLVVTITLGISIMLALGSEVLAEHRNQLTKGYRKPEHKQEQKAKSIEEQVQSFVAEEHTQSRHPVRTQKFKSGGR